MSPMGCDYSLGEKVMQLKIFLKTDNPENLGVWVFYGKSRSEYIIS